MIEVRIHSRGGQGMVTASQILASALVCEGKYIQAFPEFGPERRGAPLKAYLRFNDMPILKREPVISPNVLVVSDETLLSLKDTLLGVSADTVFIVNTEKNGFNLSYAKVFTVPATSLALKIIGRAIVNTAMVGAFIKAIGIPSLSSVERVLPRFLNGKRVEKNFELVKAAWEQTRQVNGDDSG
ncbi:MAG: pyruvate/ketoisovalerate oxidoreductase subunit gamma [Deltaproteobacteria bacterium]|jgi:pyruvate ferredoxin oxidoreductase gamma subunit|nr:Pyruvate synthase subunit PorC [bacterium HR37]GIW48029.1 MAG: pyruvate/ketoisovalerate oxidoreductase subunit gamma [Deltaproteobacteria bacterium]